MPPSLVVCHASDWHLLMPEEKNSLHLLRNRNSLSAQEQSSSHLSCLKHQRLMILNGSHHLVQYHHPISQQLRHSGQKRDKISFITKLENTSEIWGLCELLSSSPKWWPLSPRVCSLDLPTQYRPRLEQRWSRLGPPWAGPAECLYGMETGSPKAGPKQREREKKQEHR